MVNLLITMSCNRSCSYCFAKEKLYSYAKSESIREMSLEDLDRVMAVFGKKQSGYDSVGWWGANNSF